MASQYQIDLLADLLSPGIRNCSKCGTPVDDADNFTCQKSKGTANNGIPIITVTVDHIACP